MEILESIETLVIAISCIFLIMICTGICEKLDLIIEKIIRIEKTKKGKNKQ